MQLVFAHSYSLETVTSVLMKMLWQTVQFLVHVGTRMTVDSCVAVPAASSMWTVQRRRSCEDRSGLCVSLERQGRHAQLNAGTDGWGSRRPVDT